MLKNRHNNSRHMRKFPIQPMKRGSGFTNDWLICCTWFNHFRCLKDPGFWILMIRSFDVCVLVRAKYVQNIKIMASKPAKSQKIETSKASKHQEPDHQKLQNIKNRNIKSPKTSKSKSSKAAKHQKPENQKPQNIKIQIIKSRKTSKNRKHQRFEHQN